MGSQELSFDDLEHSKSLIRERLVAEVHPDPDVLDRMEVMFELNRFATRLSRDFESLHRLNGLTWAGFRILNMLWAVGELEPSRLADLTGASRASISSVLNSLEAAELISRSVNPVDRRVVRVELTDKGRAMLVDAIPIQAQREQAWLSVLSQRDLGALRRIMQRLMTQPTPS